MRDFLKQKVESYKKISTQVKATICFTICNFFQNAINAITVPIFTRLMDAEQYGVYSIYQSWFNIIVIFATLNISGMLINTGIIKYEKEQGAFFKATIILGNLATILVFIVYVLFRYMIGEIIGISYSLIVLMFCQFLFLPAYEVWVTKKKFDYQYQTIILFTLLYTIISSAISVVCVLLAENKGSERVFAFAIVQIVFYATLYFSVIKKNYKAKTRKEHYVFVTSFSVRLIPHYLANQVLARADILMINYYCRAGKAGIYSMAYSIATLVSIFMTSLNNSFVPWIYRKLDKNETVCIAKRTNGIIVIVLLINTCFMAFAPEIMRIFSTEEYFESIYVIPPVATGMFFMFIYGLFANVELFYEKASFMAFASCCVAVVNIILNGIFIPKCGYIVAAYTTLVSYMLYCVIHYYFMVKKCTKLSIYDVGTIIRLSIIQIVIMLLFVLSYQVIVLRVILITTIFCIILARRNELIDILKGDCKID